MSLWKKKSEILSARYLEKYTQCIKKRNILIQDKKQVVVEIISLASLCLFIKNMTAVFCRSLEVMRIFGI